MEGRKKDKIHLVHCDVLATEGGMARNLAFYKYYVSRTDVKVYNLFTRNVLRRVLNMLFVLRILFFSKGRKILLHQGTLLYVFTKRILDSRLLSRCIFHFLQRAGYRNEFFLEINDLPYEQSLDLEVNLDLSEFYEELQKRIFELKNIRFLFAANEMRHYAEHKYNLDENLNEVVVNGGPYLEDMVDLKPHWVNDKRLKFIYAGSLNKGRQIEELIRLFQSLEKECILILVGGDGEWVENLDRSENIYYQGALSEQRAHYIVSLCDWGISPYDISRLYYNICYPTKVAFYLTAGINVLSTPTKELKKHFVDSNSLYLLPIEAWGDFIKTKIPGLHWSREKNIDSQFYWENILKNTRFSL